MTAAVQDTKPFSPFEWMIAGRYLRARRKEGFISVIAGFSFLGIMLGVATLIIVMAVMNGFRHDLFAKIMGLNGHVIVQKIAEPFNDYAEMSDRIAKVPGVETAMPVIEGQVMVSSSTQALGGLVRGVREGDLKSLKLVSGNVRAGTLDGFDKQTGIAMGVGLANSTAYRSWRYGDAHYAARRTNTVWYGAAFESLSDHVDLRTRHVRIRPHDDLHAARGGAEILREKQRG